MNKSSRASEDENQKPDPGQVLGSGFSVEELENQLIRELSLSASCEFAIAFSGGCDSRVLLDAMVELRDKYGFRLRCLHFDHGLHADSEVWRKQCETVCQQYSESA